LGGAEACKKEYTIFLTACKEASARATRFGRMPIGGSMADDGRGARSGRDGVAREELGGADPAAARGAERLVERHVLGVAAEVEPLAREDEERVAVVGG